MNNSRIVALFFLVIFVVYGYLTTSIPLDFWSEEDVFNARSLPYLVSGSGILICALLLLVPSPSTDWDALRGLRWGPAILLLIAMSLYGTLIEFLGFIAATLLFLVGSYLILGERRPLAMILASIPLVLGFWWLMHFLGIYLNPGELFSATFSSPGQSGA